MLGLLALAIVAASTLIYMANVKNRRLAETLLRDVGTLRVGESTIVDLQSILEHYPRHDLIVSGSDPDEISIHSVQVGTDVVGGSGWYCEKCLTWLRFHPWLASAAFVLQGPRLILYSYLVTADPLFVSSQLTLPGRRAITDLDGGSGEYGFRVGRYPTTESRALQVEVTTSATEGEIEHAFDFQLFCVTNFRGCRQLCEVMPSAWNDATRYYQKYGKEVIFSERCEPIGKGG